MVMQIWNILEKSAKDNPAILKTIEEIKVFNAWEKAAAGRITTNSRPEKLADGVLYLKAKNSVWAQQLNSMKDDLIEKINIKLGEKKVSDLRFMSGMTPAERGDDADRAKMTKRKCAKCGIEFSGGGKICVFCEREEKEAIAGETYGMLKKQPHMSFEKYKMGRGASGEVAFMRIKRNIKQRLLDRLITGSRDLGKKDWEAAFLQYAETIMGKSFKDISEKDKKAIKQAVQNKINNYNRRRKPS